MPNMGDLEGPTARPDEPVTAGLQGAPNSLIGPNPQHAGTGVAAMLTRMAAISNSSALSQLAQQAQSMGQ
ncbi:MAG: hypothetical protein ACYCU7_18855 [Acidimicrobiales bacterium]